ncbi:nuclease harbi1-like isoform x2 protein [Lasius niger]|uniref:Nuclease harbi1-like isoform x2 protein n=1 Tax=Lasius niger TaxID=67767 RepID=A0A0J7KB44_LASNI|nr:nuclease harbi1-like isoform x2 protein [Lasius niger]
MQHANNNHCWIFGDSGYPLEPWLLTPFPEVQPVLPFASAFHAVSVACIVHGSGALGHRTIGHVANGHVANGHETLHTVQLDTVHLDTVILDTVAFGHYLYINEGMSVLEIMKLWMLSVEYVVPKQCFFVEKDG